MKATKIVATLGPASDTVEIMTAMIEAGADVFRLNFSHGTPEDHAGRAQRVREAAARCGREVGIMGDLQGPRIRIGDLHAPRELAAGESLVLVPEHSAHDGEIPITYDELCNDVAPGNRILINDGLIELVVTAVDGARVTATVVHGGTLSSHKGMNLPGIAVSAPSITDKDKADIVFAVESNLDALALSFVRRAEDIESLRKLVPKSILVVAKIEKDVALQNIEEIMQATDAVMDSPNCIAIDEAENRLHVQKAIMAALASQ